MAFLNFFERIFHHMDLMDRMMEKLGVVEKLKSSPDGANVLRRAASRCRGCRDAEECETFLDAQGQADEAPAYCRNHDLFERLKREIEAEHAAA